MKERILEALGRKPMSKVELAKEFGIELAPLNKPISNEEDALGKTLSTLQEGRFKKVGKKIIFTRVGCIDVQYDPTRTGRDAYINYLRPTKKK